jgi:DNA-binding transcriptional ArsR family regulator
VKKNSSFTQKPRSPLPVSAAGPGFTYLSNHTHVLVCVSADPAIRLRDLASLVGITERAVQRIVMELEAAGVLKREREGRRNHYKVNKRAKLRHPLEAHCTVGGLLDWVHAQSKH